MKRIVLFIALCSADFSFAAQSLVATETIPVQLVRAYADCIEQAMGDQNNSSADGKSKMAEAMRLCQAEQKALAAENPKAAAELIRRLRLYQ